MPGRDDGFARRLGLLLGRVERGLELLRVRLRLCPECTCEYVAGLLARRRSGAFDASELLRHPASDVFRVDDEGHVGGGELHGSRHEGASSGSADALGMAPLTGRGIRDDYWVRPSRASISSMV